MSETIGHNPEERYCFQKVSKNDKNFNKMTIIDSKSIPSRYFGVV